MKHNYIFTNLYLEKNYPNYMENTGVVTTKTIKRFMDKTNCYYSDFVRGEPYTESIELSGSHIPVWLLDIYHEDKMLKVSYKDFAKNYVYSNYNCLCAYDKNGKQYLYLNPIAIGYRYLHIWIMNILDKSCDDITSDDVIYIYPHEDKPELVFVSCSFINEHNFGDNLLDLEKDQKRKNISSDDIFYRNIMTVKNAVDNVDCVMAEKYRLVKGDNWKYDVSASRFYDKINHDIKKYLGEDYVILFDDFEDVILEELEKRHKELSITENGYINRWGYYDKYYTLYGLISIEDAIELLLYDKYGNNKPVINGKLLDEDVSGRPDPNIVKTPK